MKMLSLRSGQVAWSIQVEFVTNNAKESKEVFLFGSSI